MRFLFPNMKERSYKPELMDDPHCDKKLLLRTVNQFTLINRLFSRSRSLIKREFLSRMNDPQKTYTFLDIGAGGGDIAIWLAKECRKRNITIDITCLDYDPTIVTHAKAATDRFDNIRIVQGSAFELEKHGTFDFIFANHFLHHLNYDDIRNVIESVERQAATTYLLNDLTRSNAGYFGYTLFTGLFLKKSFAFYDGRLSILRGFTKDELSSELKQFNNLAIETTLPSRIIVKRNQKVHN